MAILIPAILTKDPDEVIEKLKFLESIPEIIEVQIDFEDGRFVPNTTVLPSDLGHLDTRLAIEAHLMVTRPQQYFHDLEILPVNLAVLHFESFSKISDLKIALNNARLLGFRCGVAINPETDISVFDGLIDQIDVVLLMSVHPGFQGKSFIVESLDRLEALRNKYKNVIIEVDGGLNLDNFQNLVAHGADRLVVGSGIWQTPDPRETIYQFLKKLK